MLYKDRYALFSALLPFVSAPAPGLFGQRGPGRRPAPARVHVEAVSRANVPRLLYVVGTVKASATVGVKPRVTGEIRQIHFQEGQDVREGQPLIGIDPRPFEAALREKSGLLAKSQARLAKARRRHAPLRQAGGRGLREP